MTFHEQCEDAHCRPARLDKAVWEAMTYEEKCEFAYRNDGFACVATLREDSLTEITEWFYGKPKRPGNITFCAAMIVLGTLCVLTLVLAVSCHPFLKLYDYVNGKIESARFRRAQPSR
jgi:hypothetical protein